MTATRLHKDVIETLWNAKGCSADSVYVQWLAANIAKNTCASDADWHHEIKDYMGIPGNEVFKALVMNSPSISPPREETREDYRERKLKRVHLRVPRKIGDSQRASEAASDKVGCSQ